MKWNYFLEILKELEDPGNCQPISFISAPGMIRKHIILQDVVKLVGDKEVIRDSKHDFTKGKLTDLMAWLISWLSVMDWLLQWMRYFLISCTQTSVRSMIPHNSHASQLEAYGFDGWTVTWRKNWIVGLIQRFTVNGFKDLQPKWKAVESDVPQLSLLGPILFIVFFNYTLSKFADDTKLCGAVDPSDTIQRDLDRLKECAYANLMKFKRAKSKVLHPDWGNPQHHYCGIKRLREALLIRTLGCG